MLQCLDHWKIYVNQHSQNLKYLEHKYKTRLCVENACNNLLPKYIHPYEQHQVQSDPNGAQSSITLEVTPDIRNY